LSFLLHAALRP